MEEECVVGNCVSVGRRVNQDRVENGKNGRKSHRKANSEIVSE